MENEYRFTDDADRMKAVLDMGTFCIINGLPLPQHFHSLMSTHVDGNTNMWPFEAKVPYINGEDREALVARQLAWCKEWIADVARRAKGTGVKIEKIWSDTYFSVILTHEEGHWRIDYSVKREAVCERKVIEKKVVPAHEVPEHIEEVVEWVCNDKSLLDE